jgi:hypothetical protein
MSLLRKALSRVESQLLAPAGQDLNSAPAEQLLVPQVAAAETSESASQYKTSEEPPSFEPSAVESAQLPVVPVPSEALFTADFETADETVSEIAWQRLDELQELVTTDLTNYDSVALTESAVDIGGIDLPALLPSPPISAPLSPSPPSAAPAFEAEKPTAAIFPASTSHLLSTQPLNLKPEFRELRDQLLSRLPLTQHPTVMFVDAGQTCSNVAWLLPIAAGMVEKASSQISTADCKVLLVEAAGPSCGLSEVFGIDTHVGLTHVLNGRSQWQAAIQPTFYPNIKLLGAGAEPFRADHAQRLVSLWPELTRQFDVLLVAAGPIPQAQPSRRRNRRAKDGMASDAPAELFLPLSSAAVLCLELGATPAAAAKAAQQRLSARGIKVLGCIIRPMLSATV